MEYSTRNVAIIGGGLAGMAMALALHQLSIPCTVYEARDTHSASKTSSGAVMLSPNALRILDGFGVYPELQEKSFAFEYVYYKDADERTIDRYPLGNEALFGYKALRVYRQELLDILYNACFERKIAVHFNKKFTNVVLENDDYVLFAFADRTTATASLLIGADGIHSRVREYVAPGVQKKFMGLTALTWETPTKQLRVPKDKDYKFPVSVLTSNGVFVLAPQKPDGSAMLSGTQFPIEDQTREGWDRLMADKQGLIDGVRKGMNMNAWPEIVKSAMEDIDADSMNMWAFYSIPRLERWTSEKRHVAILGDSAHAIPPTSGQGASQAFEDVMSLALLLSTLRENPGIKWEEALDFWQKMRQDRIDDLIVLTKQLNNKRLPLEKQKLLGKGEVWVDESAENPDQMAWLYTPNIEDKVKTWADGKLKGDV
ncbi:putative kynurenine 3-monooxygenase protein [Rosellinia necatrix]|uniref:Putative kynurenine 3-monooxygenase protein n=1 Tax=Rosellinia necatrix TaxID=77044 RepID=A0A1S7UNI5_ROSNE|nr:putative kynurenine 3-monooxygenase protein [Rosellinia necatrix]